MAKASWTPFLIMGSCFLGNTIVQSQKDWQELLNQYRGIFRDHTEQVVLQAIHEGVNTRGLPTFTLEHKQGITLKNWAKTQGMNLVG